MFQHKFILIFLAASLLATGQALSQESSNSWYVSGLASYVDDDQDRNVDDGLSGGQLAVGIPFGSNWTLEIFGLYNEFNADTFNADQEQRGFGAGIIRWFNPGAQIKPYVGIAGGYSDTSRVSGIDESAPMTSGALGALVRFGNSSFAWRTEARYRHVMEDIALSDVYLSTGLQWSPGASGSDRSTGKRGARRSDGDADGVSDEFDRCPESKPGVAVDAQGCSESDDDFDKVVNRLDRCPRTPRNVAVNSRGCPPDSDRDGVIDALDSCRGTPWGVGVDERGCPLTRDADNDGVNDENDRCANTAAGVAVDEQGCALPTRIELPGVRFKSNSSDLIPETAAALEQAAKTLLADASIFAEVAGHTDSRGEAAYNQWLSGKRAAAVRSFLIARGVDANRLTARGYGESEPIADNLSAAGRARNRRVELRTVRK